jgi:hypothetical protein
MKPFILIVRGPSLWLSYLEDSPSSGKNLSRTVKEKLATEFEEAAQVYNKWIKDQEVKGVIQISSRLTNDQRILSTDTEIDFNLLKVIEGAKVLQVIFVLVENWDHAVALVKDCPLPNNQYSIEIREVQLAKTSLSL